MEVAIAVVLLLFGVVCYLSRRPSNFPPGPKGLPLVGYAPFIRRYDPRYLYKSLVKLSDIYGPVVGFFVGPSQPFITVCGYEAVKEAQLNEDLNGRIDNNFIRMRTFNQRLGLVAVEGEFWQEQRRFALRHLRDLGFGRTSLENLIQEEIHDLMREMKAQADSTADGVVNFKSLFNVPLINIMWALFAGERFQHDDVKLNRLVSTIDAFLRNVQVSRLVIPVPSLLLRWPGFLKFFLGAQMTAFQAVQDFVRESIDQHEKDDRSGDDAPRDYIDVYLAEMKRQNVADGSSHFTKNQLISSIMDLFVAGADTTSQIIGFTLLYLIHHPDIQTKVQAELDQVCGDSLPLLAHRSSLTYTEAVLMEVLRCTSIAPLGVPHRAMKDTHLQGYFIPKGTVAMFNIYSVHMDGSYWVDPEVFRPERHLTAEGKLIKTDHLMPFGNGKRMCLGESLARNNFFLFTTALLKTFEFSGIPGEPLPTTVPNYSVTNSYNGFKAVVSLRQQ